MADNALFKVKYGLKANLPAYSEANAGQILVTFDERAIYFDAPDNSGAGGNGVTGGRIRIGDFQRVQNLPEAAQGKTLEQTYGTELYFIESLNALAVAKGNEWTQINPDTGYTSISFSGGSGIGGAPVAGEVITGVSVNPQNARGLIFTVGTVAAANVAVTDTDNKFTGTDVEAVLAEIQGNVDTLDGSLADVAKSGDADDVLYEEGTGGANDISVKDALDDIYDAIGAGGSVAQQITAAIEALDGSATIASESSGVVTIKAGISEVDGVVDNSSGTDITLAKVATTGAAVDVSYGSNSTVKAELDKLEGDNNTSGSIAKSIKDAVEGLDVSEFVLASENNGVVTIKGIKEVDGKIAAGTDTNNDIALGTAAMANKATTAIAQSSTDQSLVSAAQVATFVANEIADLEGAMHFEGVITRQTGETDAQAIARVITSPEAGDVVVMSDNAKEYIYANSTVGWREVGDEGLYVQKTTTIAGVDLQDNITQSELQTALGLGSAAYENTSAFDAAGAAADVLGTSSDAASDNTVYGAKAAVIDLSNSLADVATSGDAEDVTYDNTDSGLTATDVQAAIDEIAGTAGSAIQSVTTGSTNGTIAVDDTDVAVYGLGSAAYTASTDYDASGTAAGLIAALDADLDASGTAAHSGTFVVSGVTEVDGVLTAVDSVEVEAAGAAAAVLGTVSDTASDNTVYGAKAYADSIVAQGLSWGTF